MTQLTMAALRAAEMLKSFSGATGNPLNALLTFLQPLLEDRDGQRFDPHEFSVAVRDAYGWNFTADVAEGFNKTLREKGWLEASVDGQGKIRHDDGRPVQFVRCPPTNDVQIDQPIEDVIEQITTAFKSFLGEKGMPFEDVYNDEDDMVAEIVKHLVENFGQRSSEEPNAVAAASEEKREHGDEDEADDQRSYQVGRFVSEVQVSGGALSSHFDRIAAVGLLAELAQDFSKPTSRVTKSKLAIYLDSPIAHDLVGVSGRQAAEQTRSILRRLREMGASIYIFDQSIKEMLISLKTILAKAPSERFGAIQEAFVSGELDEAYVHTIVSDPAKALAEWSVQVKSTAHQPTLKPDHFFSLDHFHRFFDYLVSAHRPGDTRAEARSRHDANAVAYIMRLRRGHESDDIFKTQHVFLTRNRTFASLARQFCTNEDLISREAVGPFINMADLAASVWLRTGLYETSMDIPRRRLLAGCERVLSLKRPVMIKAQRAILSLRQSPEIDSEKIRQIEAILTQDRSRLLISDKIRGSKRDVGEDDLLDIYRRILADEEVKGYRKGRLEVTEDRDRVMREKEMVETELQRVSAEAQKERDRLNAEAEEQLLRVDAEAREREAHLSSELAGLRGKVDTANAEQNDRLVILLAQVNSDLITWRRRISRGLMLLAFVLFATSLWKEFVPAFNSDPASQRMGINSAKFLFVCGLLPALLLIIEQAFRLFGFEKPIEKLVLMPWAEGRFLRLAEERGVWKLLGEEPHDSFGFEADRLVLRGHAALQEGGGN